MIFTGMTSDMVNASKNVRTYSGMVAVISMWFLLLDAGHSQLIYAGRLGFTDAEYTAANGFQRSEITGLAGDYFRGRSVRYGSGSMPLGDSAWIATGLGQTIRVGLSGAAFGTNTSAGTSAISWLNASGISAGTSAYIAGGMYFGDASWVADSVGNTVQTGLFSAPLYQRNDGFRQSAVSGLTAAGFSWGTSTIFNSGSTALGNGAWVANASGVTARVGLSGNGYQRADGTQATTIRAINSIGFSVGFSDRYDAEVNRGRAAWSATPNGVTVLVGQYDASHIRADGYGVSEAQFVSDNGFVAGYSNLYSGMSSRGQTAWRVAPNGALTQLGYIGPDYSDGGTFYSAITGLSQTGNAIGYSIRNPTGGYASTGWFVAATGAILNVGLTGSGYTNIYGQSSNRPELITESGWVAGSTNRYTPYYAGTAVFVQNVQSGGAHRVGLYAVEQTNSFGETDNRLVYLTEDGSTAGYSLGTNYAWAADSSGNSSLIGLYGSAFGNSSVGYQTAISGMTESGYVWGTSRRIAGGFAGWLFSVESGTQISLSDFDLTSPTGYGTSAFRGVTESGIGYGYYFLYDAEEGIGRETAFIWSESFGFVSISNEISGGIEQYGWENFASAYATSNGLFAGNGLLSDGSQGAYLIVPEPTITWLSVLALVSFGGVFLRRRIASPRSLDATKCS